MKKTGEFRQEAIGGVSTFLTMACIIFVQPAVLTACGVDFGVLRDPKLIGVIFSLFFLDIFDSMGTLIGGGVTLSTFSTNPEENWLASMPKKSYPLRCY